MLPISYQTPTFYQSINSTYPRFSGQALEASSRQETTNTKSLPQLTKEARPDEKASLIASQFIKSGILEEKAFPNLPITNADFLKAFYQKAAFHHADLGGKLQNKLFKKQLNAFSGQELPLSQLANIAHKANAKYSKVHPLLQKIAPAIQVNTIPAIASAKPLIAQFINDLQNAIKESWNKNETQHYRSQRILSIPSYIKALHQENSDKVSLIMSLIHTEIKKENSLEMMLNYLRNKPENSKSPDAESLLYVTEDSMGLSRAGKVVARRLLQADTKK